MKLIGLCLLLSLLSGCAPYGVVDNEPESEPASKQG
jgi:hypothetical protein